MPKKRSEQQPSTSGDAKGDIHSRLSCEEARAVLNCLLRCHPELQPEAEAAAVDVLRAIASAAVADMVESAVLQFDYDDLNDRPGRHSWGDVEPSEAAWELCQGILLGLYRVRGQRNDILEWAGEEHVVLSSRAESLETDWEEGEGWMNSLSPRTAHGTGRAARKSA